MRNLVVCCDGTWNTPDQEQGGVPTPTNVVKLLAACEEDEGQLRYYHPGVGTEGSRVKRLIDGGIGRGLDENIQSAYKWLCSNFQAGDRIFLFGFSRGAYTARSLSGFILRCGLLDPGNLSQRVIWERVQSAYDQGYRKQRPKQSWGGDWPSLVDENGDPPGIHFVGVWDTVGARGVPDDLVLLDILIDNPDDYRFHNTDLDERVRHAYHAVALDEPGLDAGCTAVLTGQVDGPRGDVEARHACPGTRKPYEVEARAAADLENVAAGPGGEVDDTFQVIALFEPVRIQRFEITE